MPQTSISRPRTPRTCTHYLSPPLIICCDLLVLIVSVLFLHLYLRSLAIPLPHYLRGLLYLVSHIPLTDFSLQGPLGIYSPLLFSWPRINVLICPGIPLFSWPRINVLIRPGIPLLLLYTHGPSLVGPPAYINPVNPVELGFKPDLVQS